LTRLSAAIAARSGIEQDNGGSCPPRHFEQTPGRGCHCPDCSAVTWSDLIAELAASNPHPWQAGVELIVEAVFGQIADALARSERVALRGFGAFTMKQREARIGRNPRTGEEVLVDEKARPHPKMGYMLRRRLNRGVFGSRFTGRSGCQLAMVRAPSRACVLSVMPGNSRHSSIRATVRRAAGRWRGSRRPLPR
jgi:integration host factor subunit beta